MVTQDLLNYIEDEISKNTSKQTIESNLLANGWNSKDVAEGFATVLQKNAKPVPPPVVPPTPVVNPMANMNEKPMTNPVVPNMNPVLNPHQYAMPAQSLQETVSEMMKPQAQPKKSSSFMIISIIVLVLLVLGGGAFAYYKYFMTPSVTPVLPETSQPLMNADTNNFPDNSANILPSTSTYPEENMTATSTAEPEVFLGSTTPATTTGKI